MFRRFYHAVINRVLNPLENRFLNKLARQANTSSQTKIAQRRLYHYYRNLALNGSVPSLRETGFRCFSQFEEDGKLLFIFAMLGQPSGAFVDIGSADGVNSNCANLALNFGWRGVFIDGNENNIIRGREFYSNHPDT